MKEFKIMLYKQCPECENKIYAEFDYAYNNNWCPKCGYGYKEALQRASAYASKKDSYNYTGHDDAVNSGLL